MDDTAFILCPDFFFLNRPTDPSNFQVKRTNQPFIFLGPIYVIDSYVWLRMLKCQQIDDEMYITKEIENVIQVVISWRNWAKL